MKTGWLKSGGKWYFMDRESGAMVAGVSIVDTDGKTYAFDANGVWVA
jgi:glucan-binding YG repeat protein